MFSYLDGELGAGERAAFEDEISRDPGLAAEVQAFRSLMTTLDELADFSPSPDFKARVIASLRTRASARARLWSWLASSVYPTVPNVFAALLDEGLSVRQARTLSAFVARDPDAAAALASWKHLYEQLDGLPAFVPADGFGERVMARVAASRAPVRSRAPLASRIRGWLPRRRERLAAASGIAFGPTAAFAVTAYMVFSNPLVTASNVASFAWGKGTAALSGLGQALFGSAATSPATGRVFGLLDGVAAPAPSVAAVLLLLGGLTLVSAWILYKNVVKVSALEGRHAPV